MKTDIATQNESKVLRDYIAGRVAMLAEDAPSADWRKRIEGIRDALLDETRGARGAHDRCTSVRRAIAKQAETKCEWIAPSAVAITHRLARIEGLLDAVLVIDQYQTVGALLGIATQEV